MEMQRAPLTDFSAIKEFMFAGNATFTVVSKRTHERKTYRVRASEDGRVHFASILTGSDNENHFAYLGTIRAGQYSHGRNSKMNADSPASKGFAWFCQMVEKEKVEALAQAEVWHEGRCGRCNRKLTVPSSIARGIGPECATHMPSPDQSALVFAAA